MHPEWLPPVLSFPGSQVERDYALLYEVYRRDFIDQVSAVVEGDTVVVNGDADPATGGLYTHGFTHLVTVGGGERSIDYDRAAKLPWVRAILDNYTEPEVAAFWDEHPRGRTLYLWLPDHDFVVMLRKLESRTEREAADSKIIVTAYHVWSSMRHKLQKKYGKSKDIL